VKSVTYYIITTILVCIYLADEKIKKNHTEIGQEKEKIRNRIEYNKNKI